MVSPFVKGLGFGITSGLLAGAAMVAFNTNNSDLSDHFTRSVSGKITEYEPAQGKARGPYDHILTPRALNKIAFSESSGQTNAYNKKTGVLGLYQFKPDTFLEQLYKNGAELGYGHLSKHIGRQFIRDENQKPVGERYFVKTKGMEEKILNARTDPRLSRALAKKYMADGLAIIDKKLPDREIRFDKTIAYKVLHFGAGGATKIVEALQETPKISFEAVVGKQVCQNNRNICYSQKNKTPLSVKQVYALLGARLEKAPDGTTAVGYAASPNTGPN